MHQLHFTVMLPGGLEFGNEHAYAGAVDLGDAADLEQDLVAALVEQFMDLRPEHQVPIVERNLAHQLKDGHVPNARFDDLQLRGRFKHGGILARVVFDARGASADVGRGFSVYRALRC